jgi:uncharacterized protein (DUF111 family)
LPLGRGHVECRHGILPLPAPAAAECLRGVPTYYSGTDEELVTPTGAAIVSAVARRFEQWPAIVPERIGWGAGTKRFADRLNAVRAVLGDAPVSASRAEATHVVLEANVDDLTGELAGHALRALLAAGALDAWATPVTMKKGRPGLVLAALAAAAEASRLSEVFLRETSTLGVRLTPASRVERPRQIVTVETRYGAIPVKVSGGPYGEPQSKPEFDACVEAAARADVPVRVVIAAALAAFERR